MKKMLLSAAALFLLQLGATAQISTLPAMQDFTDSFTATGNNVQIYPDYTANEVQSSSRIYRDVVDFSSAPAALSVIPTGSFDGEIILDFNLANYANVNFSFVAKSMLNGTGTRPSVIRGSASVDGGATWVGEQLIGSFPNENQPTFASYDYSFPVETNNQATVKLKIFVGTGDGGSGTRAKVIMDDFNFSVITTPQLSISVPALSFTQTVGVPAQPQVVFVSGATLSADAILSVAAPYEISLSETTGYTNTLTITSQDGAIASAPVYVRLNAAAEGTTSETLSVQSTGLTATVSLTGTAIVSTASNPEPFNLSAGNYSFNAWPADAPAGTYPANMVFWTHATTDPLIDTPFNEDYNCLYSLTSRSRFSGQGDNGVSMINTGNSQYTGVCDGTDPTQDSGDTVLNGRAGAVVLALNTTGRQNVTVSWKGSTILKNNRVYGLRLQYRLGAGNANLNWNDIATGENTYTQYISGEDGTSQTFTTLLPDDVNNQEVVQVRWVYNFIETGATGSRAEVALDDVTVATDQILSSDTFSANTTFMYPNPASNGVVNFSKPLAVTIYDLTGKIVYTSSSEEIITLNLNGFSAGIYLVKPNETGEPMKLVVK